MNDCKHLGAIGTFALVSWFLIFTPIVIVTGGVRAVFALFRWIGDAGPRVMDAIERPLKWLLNAGPAYKPQDRF